MPWLALPFGDARKGSLSRLFKVRGIPMLVAIGPTGRTVTTETRNLVMCHGADAYPFTEERIKEIEAKYEEMAKAWPEKVNHGLHDHELVLTKCLFYNYDGCNGEGGVWSFYCEVCDFDLHPECALEENKGSNMDAEAEHKEHGQGEQKPKEGCICDGEVAIKLEKVKLV